MDLSQLSDDELSKLAQGESAPPEHDVASMSDDELMRLAGEDSPKKKSKEIKDDILGIPVTTIEGALRSLPFAGALAGGTVGSAAGPIGAVGGAGLGAAGGEALANAIRSGLDLETAPQTRGEMYSRPLKEGLIGAAGEGAGQAIAKIPGLIAKTPQAVKSLYRGEAIVPDEVIPRPSFDDIGFNQNIKPNSEEIQQATRRLGGEATPGMVSSNQNIQNLENVLSQSPTWGGEKVRKAYQPIRKGLQESAENLAGSPSSSAFEAGEQFKAGVTKKIAEKVEPLAGQFEKIRESSRYIKPAQSSLNKAADRLMKQDLAEFAELPQGQAIKKYSDMIRNSKSLDSLKQLRSSVDDDMGRALDTGDGQLALALGKVKGSIQRLERREILRSAIEATPSRAEGEVAAKELINEIKSVNKGWRSLMGELEEIAKAGGIKKISSPSHLSRIIDDMPSEKISERFFNTKNYAGLRDVKTYLPEEFEILRQNKLGQIAEKSLTKGEPDPVKLVRNLKAIGKESRELLFGKDGEQVLRDMETVLNSMPSKVGASDTPRGMAWFERLKPSRWGEESQSAYNYMLLTGRVQKSVPSQKSLKALSQAAGYGAAGTMSNREPRGQDKWATNGLKKIQSIYPDDQNFGVIDPINASPKVRRLLIEASDLEPGSRAFNRVISDLNKEFGGND